MGKHRFFFLIIAALAGGLFGCSDLLQPESCATQQRMITKEVDFDVESEIVSAMEEAGALQVVHKFEFKDEKFLQELKKGAVRVEDLRVEDGFLKFRTTGDDPWITFPPVNIPAEEVNAVAVRASITNSVGRYYDKLEVLFATKSNPQFHGALTTEVRTDGAIKKLFLFTDPGREPKWRGTITKLRLDPVYSRDQEVAVQDMSLLKINRDADLSALNIQSQGVGRTWTGPFLRNVVFSRFSEPLEWALSLPCKPEFHAQVALPGVYRHLDLSPVQALLEVKNDTGAWTEAARLSIDGSEGERVFQGIPLKASLDRWAGQRVTLRLRVVEGGSAPSRYGLVYWANPYVTSRRRVENKPNVILISIDTLRADHLSLYGYQRSTSPHLDEWAAKGVVFKNAFSHSPWTLPSHASMFTSLYPFQHLALYPFNYRKHPVGLDRLSESFITLSEQFQRSGYVTGGFAGGAYVSWEVNMDQGFDSWHQPFEFGRDLSRVYEWLDKYSMAQFFLFLHTYEAHDYFRVRMKEAVRKKAEEFYVGSYRGVLLDSKLNRTDPKVLKYNDAQYLKAVYDAQISFVDEWMAQFFEDLAQRGLSENTVLVVVSDHGEEFLEHGDFAHGQSLYDELIWVPLIISFPKKLPQGIVITSQVRLVDLYPTILELAGLPTQGRIEGISLLNLIQGYHEENERLAFSVEAKNHLSSIRSSRAKYISKNWQESTFDLIKDPFEQSPMNTSPETNVLKMHHDRFVAYNGGYHLLARGKQMNGCPINITTEGQFMNVLPRLLEKEDTIELKDDWSHLAITLNLDEQDVDGLYFLVWPDSAPVKVELCEGDGKAPDGLTVSLGADGSRRVGSSWTIGQDIKWEEVKVSRSPVDGDGGFDGVLALWKLETRPTGAEAASVLPEEQKNEFMRRLRSLGYVQ